MARGVERVRKGGDTCPEGGWEVDGKGVARVRKLCRIWDVCVQGLWEAVGGGGRSAARAARTAGGSPTFGAQRRGIAVRQQNAADAALLSWLR